jgi:23S rRNA pseudouridine955/2504/2580 synthase
MAMRQSLADRIMNSICGRGKTETAISFRRLLSESTAADRALLVRIQPHDAGQKIVRIIQSQFVIEPGFQAPPRSLVMRWMRTGALRDGSGVALALGALVTDGMAIYANAEVRSKLRSKPLLQATLSSAHTLPAVVYEDESLVAINKPTGVASQPGDGGGGGGGGVRARRAATVDNGAGKSIVELLPALASKLNCGKLRMVHRLDRDTSGLLLLTKTAEAANAMRGAFADRAESAAGASAATERKLTATAGALTYSISKHYLALVDAAAAVKSGVIVEPVRHVDSESRKLVSLPAVTRFTARDLQLPAATSVFLLQPLTGRKHQLRQHIAHLFGGRCGIRGDPRYPLRRATAPAPVAAHTSGAMCLHAWHYEVRVQANDGKRPDRALRMFAPLPSHIAQLASKSAPGVSTAALQRMAEEMLLEHARSHSSR